MPEDKPDLRQYTLQDHIRFERTELSKQIQQLSSFLGGDNFQRLDEEERNRLLRQEKAMRDYLIVLDERIAAPSFSWNWPRS